MSVYEQLADYCPCVCTEDMESFIVAVDAMIQTISAQLCWSRTGCETFLTGERVEYIPYVPKCNRCDCGILHVPLYYAFGIESASIEVKLLEREGLLTTATDLEEGVNYAYDPITKELLIDEKTLGVITTCNCCTPRCKTYLFEIRYIAGFDELPDCLLPVLCDTLQIVIDKNTCSAQCCGGTSTQEDSLYLESIQDKTFAQQVTGVLQRIVMKAHITLLRKYSLCHVPFLARVI